MERFNSGITDIFKMEIDDQAKSNFIEISRWTKFIAVVFFVMFGLILLAGIILAILIPTLSSQPQFAAMGSYGPVLIIICTLALIAVYFYPTYALLKFSGNVKAGLNTGDKELFNSSIRHLKGMFKYMGILMIIILILYGVEIIFGLLVAMGNH